MKSKPPELATLLAAQTELFQARDRLAKIEAVIDRHRTARAEVIADDAELAELKRQRQRLLADRGLAETEDAQRAADRALAAHDAEQAKRQATADEIGDTLAGLEHERERMQAESRRALQSLMDAQRRYLEAVTGPAAIDGYLAAGSELFRQLVNTLAMQRLAGRFGAALRSGDSAGTGPRTRRVDLLYGDIATLPRPATGFTGRYPPELPPEPNDSYVMTLWRDSDLNKAVAEREQQLVDEFRRLGIEIV